MLRELFIYSIIISSYYSAFGQTLDFKNYTTTEGLITDEIYNLHQDKQGYLWVFSKYGTVKYNSQEFKPVLLNLPFTDSFIYSIYENAKGKKWVANSNAKIYELRNDSALLIKGIETISTELRNAVSEISKLYVDDSLSIYAYTKGHSYKFIRKADGNYFPVELCKDLDSDCSIIKVKNVDEELLPIYTHFEHSNLFNFCDRKFIYVELPDARRIKLHKNYLQSSIKNMKRYGTDIYFTVLNKIYKISDTTTEVSGIEVGKSVILNYKKDHNKHLWVACLNDGLYEIDEKDSVVNHFFLNTTVNDIVIDHQNNLWISTPGKGLFQCKNFNNNNYFTESSGLGVQLSFIKRIDDELFVANIDGSIFLFSGNKMTQIRKEDNNQPLDIAKGNGDYIITLRFSVEKYIQKTKKLIEISNIKQPTFTRILTKNKDTLIYIWRKGIMFAVNHINVKKIDLGRKIITGELINNELWLGTENGVYKYKSDFSSAGIEWGGVLIAEKDSLTANHSFKLTEHIEIVRIVKDNCSNYWFCSQGNGLFELKKQKLFNYSVKTGLPSNIINSINFTNDHSALLSTNKGLFISKLDTKSGSYLSWENLYEGEIQDAIFFKNKIYVACKKGLVIINDWRKVKAKKIFFNLAYIQDDSLTYNASNFRYIQNNKHKLEFRFDVVTFEAGRPLLKYLLTGPTSESGVNTTSTIKFTNLSPGSYTLSIFPLIEGGEELKIRIPFFVKPTFWQTVFFKILIAFFLVLLFVIAAGAIINYRRKKEALKLKNEQLLLEYKLVALKAQINPHFMSNCLSAIQDLILSDNTTKATFYVAQFGLLVRQILDYSSQPIITLKEELDLLVIYIELEQLRFENKFVFNLTIPENVNTKNIYVPPLILNPIVENAIWHGLLPLKNARLGELNVVVEIKKDNLVFNVQDNGIGRKASEKLFSAAKNKSYGIKITEQRLKNINYLFNSEDSSIRYDDLTDLYNEPCGTSVFIFLPLNLTPFANEQN